LASDGNWYPAGVYPGYWLASDGNWYPDYTHPGYAVNTLGSRKQNRLAMVALAAGIITTCVVLVPLHSRAAMVRPLWLTLSLLGSIVSLAGAIAGVLALKEIRRTGERGKAQAIIGFIPCAFVTTVEVATITIYIFFFILLGGLHH
jgi:hypothetical protein